MQNLRNLTLFVLLLMGTLGLSAQNGNVVVSEVQVDDMGNGTGMIVVKLSGNQASEYAGGTFVIAGDRVANGSAGGSIGEGGRVVVEPPVPGNGNSNGNQQVLLAAVFPLAPAVGNQSDVVEMQFTFHRRIGNGLDYTYSRVGRIKFDRSKM